MAGEVSDTSQCLALFSENVSVTIVTFVQCFDIYGLPFHFMFSFGPQNMPLKETIPISEKTEVQRS